MINLSKKPLFIASSSEIYPHAIDALNLIEKVFSNAHTNFRATIHKIERIFRSAPHEETQNLLTECHSFLTHTKGDNHHSQVRRKKIYFSDLTKTDLKQCKTILRFVFIFLHKRKTLVLPPNFTRPLGSITSFPEAQKLFYCETVHPFLDMETSSNINLRNGRRAYTATQRLWQTGIKALLMSSFFAPEDINAKDLQELRLAQLRDKRNALIPLPTVQIANTLLASFPNRTLEEVRCWLESTKTTNNLAAVQYSTREAILIDMLKRHVSPLEVTRGLTKYRRYGVRSFSSDGLRDYKINLHAHQDSIFFGTAMNLWINAEDSYIAHKSNHNHKILHLALGKLNLYLFVYLPLWITQNPHSKFKYPSSPSKFTGAINYNCEAPKSPDRPLSMCELFREIGYIESHQSQAEIRNFFRYLVDFGNELDGCGEVTQPVRNIPASKKYACVTKNVFTGNQLRLFIAYHYALSAGADYYFENSVHLKMVIDEAKRNNKDIDTVDLGFVPIMYNEGKISFIRKLHPRSFHFVIHDHTPYYNPGSVTFSLLLLEIGVRGQTLQWLDARTYDRTSHRISRDSLQLTTLWLNTDKIQKIPFIIVTAMGNLWLLDDQRRWRQHIIDEVGVSGFTKEVFYDHDPESHWGKILPLFAANPVTGDPFTDNQYSRLWKYHCLNFQKWYTENTFEKSPIVGLLPLRKTPEKTYFTWEEWINKINSDDVLVVSGSPKNKIYLGDYCPVSLRAYATPHSARASFVTDMSTHLPPEAVALLTGQSLSTIIKYNKGHRLIADRLQGAFNNKDGAWYLTNTFHSNFSMSAARDRIEDSVRQGTIPKTIDTLGLNSFPTSTSPKEMTGLKLIATDRSLSLGACYTHICPYNFICPEKILNKFGGVKRCALCPFAVFSSHNLPAIEAHRQKIAEEYLSTCKIVEQYSATHSVSPVEMSRLQEEVKNTAKEVISWMLVEEVLWAKIEMQRDAEQVHLNKDLVVSDAGTVTREISRSEYSRDSVEGFLTRLCSACTHPDSMSRSFEYKIDRATRLLMIKEGNTIGAALMPSNFPNAVKLAGMLRASLEFKDLDIEQFVRLINLEDKEWEKMMLSYQPPKEKIGDPSQET